MKTSNHQTQIDENTGTPMSVFFHPGHNRKTFYLVLGAVVLFGWGLHGALTIVKGSPKRTLSVDEQVYDQIARSVVEGKGFDIDEDNKGEVQAIRWTRRNGPTAHAAPLHILYIALLYSAGLGSAEIAYVNAVLFALTGVLLFLFLCRVIPPPPAFIAGALLLHHSVLSHFALRLSLMTECVYLFILVVALWTASFSPDRRILHGALLGTVLGALTLTRGEGIIFMPLLALASSRDTRRIWKDPFLWTCIVCAAIVMSPWVVRNYVHTGQFVLSRNGAGNQLWKGNNPNCVDIDSLASNQHLNSMPIPLALDADMNEVEFDKSVANHAKRFMLENPEVWLNTSLRRFLYLWQPMNLIRGHRSLVLRIILSLFATVGLLSLNWRTRATWILIAPVLVYTLLGTFLMGGNMSARLRAMMSPTECALVAAGLWWLMSTPYFLLRKKYSIRPSLRTMGVATGLAAVAALVLSSYAILGRRGPAAYAENFDDGVSTLDTISSPYWSTGVKVITEDGNSSLWLEKNKLWQGIWLVLEPGQYVAGKEYAISFDAKFQGDSAAFVRVLSYDSKEDFTAHRRDEGYQKPESPYQTIGLTKFRWNTPYNDWQRLRHIFTAPYKGDQFIRIWIADVGTTDPHSVRMDNIEIRQITLAERILREYFTQDTYRRRGGGFFK